MLLQACGFPGASSRSRGFQRPAGPPGASRGLQAPPGGSRGLQRQKTITNVALNEKCARRVPPRTAKASNLGEAEISRGMVRLD